MKRKLLGCMTLLASLLVWSCTNDPGREVVTGGETGDEVEVTFSVSSEGASLLSRAGDDGADSEDTKKGNPGGWQTSIGRGKNIDALIYAVYEVVEKNGEITGYTLLSQYGKGFIKADGKETEDDELSKNDAFTMTDADSKPYAHNGQTIVNVGEVFPNGKSYDITLRLMRNKTYCLAFWAQSSKTKAFNTDDLTKVTVNYDGALNNDELRDAFCKREIFSVSAQTTGSRTVVLNRCMAQINVGTTGADYKNMVVGEKVYNTRKYTYSQVTLKGVSNRINVVEDTIYSDEDFKGEVTFGYNKIAAYYKIDIPADDQELYLGVNYNYEKDGEKELKEEEEYLKVDLNYDGKVKGYRTYYPTVNSEGKYLTETFKYLSMCYALVPASSETGSTYSNTVLDKVSVTFATDENGASASSFTLTQVPVQRNWRTNILGGLYYMKDPNLKEDDPDYPDDDDDDDDPDDPGPDPKDPDIPEGPGDPSSVFSTANFMVVMAPAFEREYNTDGEYSDDGNDHTWWNKKDDDTTGGDDDDDDGNGDNGDDNGGDSQNA